MFIYVYLLYLYTSNLCLIDLTGYIYIYMLCRACVCIYIYIQLAYDIRSFCMYIYTQAIGSSHWLKPFAQTIGSSHWLKAFCKKIQLLAQAILLYSQCGLITPHKATPICLIGVFFFLLDVEFFSLPEPQNKTPTNKS